MLRKTLDDMDDKMAGFEDQINILKSASSTPRVE